MTWFTEGPWTIVVIALLIEAGLSIALVQTGRGKLLWAMAGVLAVATVLFAIERLVVTDHEAIISTLEGAAAALEKNDAEAVLTFVSPNAGSLRADVRSVLATYNFSEARVAENGETHINWLVTPPEARITVLGRCNVQQRKPAQALGNYVDPGFIIVLEKVSGRWLISGYDTRARKSPR